jgi:hypothetical protein
MIKNIYSGDPKMVMTPDGMTLVFKNGQPIMDAGVENQVIISLFTKPDWSGNDMFQDPSQKIGSDFEDAAREPITLTSLNNIRDAALKALESDLFGDIEIEVTNPKDTTIKVEIFIKPPWSDPQSFILTKNALNWEFQRVDPAYKKVS